LDFAVSADAARVEFRVQPFGFESGEHSEFIFWGVRVAKRRGVVACAAPLAAESVSNARASAGRDAESSDIILDERSQSEVIDHVDVSVDVIVEATQELCEIDDHADFLIASYRKILERDPDESGFGHYLLMLKLGQLTRQEVIAGLFDSVEWRERRYKSEVW
jgi:hypothetical protein